MDSFYEGDLLCARLADWAVTPEGVTIHDHRVQDGADFWEVTLETMGWVQMLESRAVSGPILTADKDLLFNRVKDAILLTSLKVHDYGPQTHLEKIELFALSGFVGSAKNGLPFNVDEFQERLDELRGTVEDVRALVEGADFLGVDVRKYLLHLVEQLVQAIDNVARVGVEAVSVAISQLFFGMCGAVDCCPEDEREGFRELLNVVYQRGKYFALWSVDRAAGGVLGNAAYHALDALGRGF